MEQSTRRVLLVGGRNSDILCVWCLPETVDGGEEVAPVDVVEPSDAVAHRVEEGSNVLRPPTLGCHPPVALLLRPRLWRHRRRWFPRYRLLPLRRLHSSGLCRRREPDRRQECAVNGLFGQPLCGDDTEKPDPGAICTCCKLWCGCFTVCESHGNR